jgi:hypothetical protein
LKKLSSAKEKKTSKPIQRIADAGCFSGNKGVLTITTAAFFL